MAAVALAAMGGCKDRARPAVTQPATAAASRPSMEVDSGPPRRPSSDWAVFQEAYHEEQDAICLGRWTGGNRLEITTDNIRRLRLDLNRLPEGAPGRGPWNLQIDRQGIQITGARGKVIDLVRSQHGNWTVAQDAPGRR
jgi:hypothetical protein